jgi:hypothetical protein
MRAKRRDLSGGAESTGGGSGRSCGIHRPHLHRFVEGELEPIRARLLEEHLTTCPECEAAREDLERERLFVVESLVSSPPLSERLTRKILRRAERELCQRGNALFARRLRRLAVALGASILGAAALLVLGTRILLGPSRDPGAMDPGAMAPASRLVAAVPERAHVETAGTEAAHRLEAGPFEPGRLERTAFPAAPVAARLPSPRLVPRRAAVTPRAAAESPTVSRLTFPRALGAAMDIPPLAPSLESAEDPCRDHNRDGEVDLSDVAHSFNILLGGVGGLPPSDLADADATDDEVDCDEACVRV